MPEKPSLIPARSYLDESSPLETAIRRLRGSLFDKQLEVINSPARFKSLCCSRRAGKTQLLSRGLLLATLENPDNEFIYLASTAKSAFELVWDNASGIPAVITALGLDNYVTINHSKHTITTQDGSTIYVSGIETLPDAERWRGHKFKLAVVDESQIFEDALLKYIVETVLTPSLLDNDGRLILSGTPKPICAGYFYNAVQPNSAWTKFGWTLFDNPKLRDPAKIIAEVLEISKETIEDPGPQREFYGKWVREEAAQLFYYVEERNTYVTLPTPSQKDRWHYALGVDLGHRDLTAIVLIQWLETSPNVYVTEAVGLKNAIVSDTAQVLRIYKSRFPGIRIIADCGALGLMIVEEWRQREGLFIEAAVKHDKPAGIRLVNNALRRGEIQINPDCKDLIDQLIRLEIDPRTQIEKPTAPCDFADALLYAYRNSTAYLFKPIATKLTEAEEWRQRELREYNRAVERFDKSEEAVIQREFDDIIGDPDLLD